MPEAPTDNALRGIGHGAMFTGTEGWLVADFGSHVIIPKGTAKDQRLSRKGVKGGFNFQDEWVKACKGGPEILFVGCGHSGQLKLNDEAKQFLAQRAIECEALNTPEAVEAYNASTRRKAALIHVTC